MYIGFNIQKNNLTDRDSDICMASAKLTKKAKKLEIHKGSDYTHKLEMLSRQLLVSTYMEEEILKEIAPKEIDLKNHYSANQSQYQPPEAKEPLPFDKIRSKVKQDYI